MYQSLYAYASDLADDGLEVALGRIRETGVNTITLAAGRQAVRLLRPQQQSGNVLFRQDGTVYFRARPERYGHIKPRVDPMVDDFDPLAELQRVAPDLDRTAWVACAHDAPRGEQHPEYVTRNAFGDPYPHSLCPAHPAVRDYVVNLCSDLARGYDLAALVLETPGWLPDDQGYHHELKAVPLDPWARTLLSLCFADATRRAAKAAGIDADRLQARARELLERYFAGDAAIPRGMVAAWWLADLVSEPQWAAFLDWRARHVADLVSDVKAALPAGTALAVIPTLPRPSAAGWLAGSDLGRLAAAADVLEIPVYRARAEDVYLDAWDVRRRAGDDAALHFILSAGHADLEAGAQTVDAARKLEQIGMAGIAFFDYGHLRLAGPGHLRAALDALQRS